MTVRESFVAQFGDEQATKVEEASLGHLKYVSDGHKDDNWGTDPFRYHFLMCISFDCFTMEKAQKYHGFSLSLEELRAWALEHADLHLHDGDVPDYIAFIAGAYFPWINWDRADSEPPEYWKTAEVDLQKWREKSPAQAAEDMRDMASKAMEMLNEHGNWEPK